MNPKVKIPSVLEMELPPSLDSQPWSIFPRRQNYDIWTDGSANLGKTAGYGIVIVDPVIDTIITQQSGTITGGKCSAPQAELTGIIEGLRLVFQLSGTLIQQGIQLPILRLYSDSEFCIKTINEWGPKRTQKQWEGKAYAEQFLDLFQFIDGWRKASSLTFIHVRGHKGLKYNELADRLAQSARQ